MMKRYTKILCVFLVVGIITILLTPSVVNATSSQYDDFLVDANSTSDININLFDYWLTTEDDDDAKTTGAKPNEGINQNHILIFGNSVTGTGKWNSWTGNNNTPYTNIVKPTLDEYGYPVLNIPEKDISAIFSLAGRKNESLAYLFDPEYESDYKKSYTNVKGLLMHSDELGDNYDCYKNFAFYDKDSNTLKLMNQPAVMGIEAHAEFGQFFPLAKLENIFTIKNDKLNTDRGLNAKKGILNHYLGMTLDANFTQPINGIVENQETGDQKEMVFQFSGDDDIWIFIDGVLIADIGGIHNAITTNINFATGKVNIRPKSDKMVNASVNVFEYYLGEKYENVQELDENYITDNFIKETDENGNITKYTFKDNTSHELKIFYLERGNGGSSLEMSFWPTINGTYEESEPEEPEPEVPEQGGEIDTPEEEFPPVTDEDETTSDVDEENHQSVIEGENPETGDYILIVIVTLVVTGIIGIGIVKGYQLHLKKNK